MTKLVMQLVGRIPNSEPDRDAIMMQVRTFKEKTKTVLEQLDAGVVEAHQAFVDDTSVAKLFEEVKVMFQDLPSRIEGRLDPMRHKGRRRFNPMMIEQFFHISEGSDDATGLLILVGLFRDELPWLHELGLEFYRAIKGGNPSQMKKAFGALMRTFDLTRHGPLGEGIRDEETYMMLRDLPHVLERYLLQALDKSQKKARKSTKASTK